MSDLLDEITFGSKQGRPRKGSVDLRLVRELTVEDLGQLEGPPASLADIGVSSGPVKLRHTHHQLARLLATGVNETTAAYMVGYTPSYVYMLKKDPAFGELLAHYASFSDELMIDAQKRLHELGINALEDLQEKLETENWSKRELMELAELAFGKGGRNGGPAAASAGPVTINVGFVQPKASASLTLDLAAEPD